MGKILEKIPLIRKFAKKDNDSIDWRDPRTTLEVVSKKELDGLQKEVIEELNVEKVIDPEALFYIHKYIDAKFDQRDFNVGDRFINKANRLDQLYSDGRAEIYAEYTGYEELMERAKEADMRLRRAIVALDPETTVPTDECRLYDDSDLLKAKYEKLSEKLNWEEK